MELFTSIPLNQPIDKNVADINKVYDISLEL